MNTAIPSVSYTRILKGAVTRAGEVWPCDRSLLGVFMGGIATALQEAWMVYEWPVLLELAEVSYYDGAWDSSTTYEAGQVVWYDSQAWVCLSESILGTPPDEDDTNWIAGADYSEPITGGYLARSNPENVVEIYEDDPQVTPIPRRMRWAVQQFVRGGAVSISRVGVRVWPVAGREGLPDTVWKLERTAPPMLEGTEWDEAETYVAGDGVWFPTDGLFYLCVTATTAGESPATASAKWSVQRIPAFFETHLIYSAVAAYLEAEKGDGPQSKKVRERAMAALEDEMRKAQESDRRKDPSR